MADGHQIAACLKHYVGYGASEGGRDYVYTEISPQTLWDTYMPPYEAGVKAGAATLMSCFNNVSGIPGTGNRYLLTDILKKGGATTGSSFPIGQPSRSWFRKATHQTKRMQP